MRKKIALLTLSVGLSGCLATNYQIDEGADVRFTAPKPSEKIVRHVELAVNRSFFLFGSIPYDRTVDIAKEVDLGKHDALVNTRIEGSMGPLPMALWIGLGVLSYGIAMVIWTPHRTTITGDIVHLKGYKATDEDQDDAEDAATTKAAPVPSPTPAPAIGEFTRLTGTFTQSAAKAGCTAINAALPSRDQLKKARAAALLSKDAGDVWTGEQEGEDGWTYNAADGATFLKDRGEELAAFCRKGA